MARLQSRLSWVIAAAAAPIQTVESNLSQITARRNALAAQIATELEGATFSGKTVDRATAQSQIEQANRLLDRMHQLASGS